jgi:hypothetical protein
MARTRCSSGDVLASVYVMMPSMPWLRERPEPFMRAHHTRREAAGEPGIDGIRRRRAQASGTISGAPIRALSAVSSSGWRCEARSASTLAR